MRIVLTGGGSGGHLFPLIAVARKLNETQGVESLYIGPDTTSRRIFEREGIGVRYILAGKMRRYLSPLGILDILKFPVGLVQAYWNMLWFMPDVVFSKGGYGSVGVVCVGWLFRIPVVIHESDIVPGLANKLLARLAKKIIVSFDATVPFFPAGKTIVAGNPIRQELFTEIPQNPNEVLAIRTEKPIVFVLGGSQGARQINDLLLLALPDFIRRYEIIHQCGEQNVTRVQKGAVIQLKSAEERSLYHLYGMLTEQEMSSAYALARVVISRAGSGAIFEVASARKPSILIPYSGGAGDHQLKNARAYKKAGAARVLSGKNITPHMLISLVDSIVDSPEKERAMSEAARRFAKPRAAGKIAEEIVKLAV